MFLAATTWSRRCVWRCVYTTIASFSISFARLVIVGVSCHWRLSHLPPLHIVGQVCRLKSGHADVFGLLLYKLSSVFFTRSRHLNFGLPRFIFPSTTICNKFLGRSSLSRYCTCPNHIDLFSLRDSAIWHRCASFQKSTFLT